MSQDQPDIIIHIQNQISAVDKTINESQRAASLIISNIKALKSQRQRLMNLQKQLKVY
jgi:hypothetical protein